MRKAVALDILSSRTAQIGRSGGELLYAGRYATARGEATIQETGVCLARYSA